jgi:hypothetical protein
MGAVISVLVFVVIVVVLVWVIRLFLGGRGSL